jgi:hypothetical protein
MIELGCTELETLNVVIFTSLEWIGKSFRDLVMLKVQIGNVLLEFVNSYSQVLSCSSIAGKCTRNSQLCRHHLYLQIDG